MKIKYVQKLPFKQNTDKEYLEAVFQIVKYLRNNEVVTEQGKYWKPSPEPSNDYEGDLMITPKSIYAGSAGIGQFFLQLYDVTKDDQYLQEAKDAAKYILNTYEGVDFFKNILEQDADGVWPVNGWGTSVYAAPAGEGIFLEQLYEKTDDSRYHDFLIQTADDAIAAGKDDGKILHWSNQADLMADGSYVFFFLYVFRKTGDKKYLDAAKKVIAFTDTVIVNAKEGGIYYKNVDLTLVGWESTESNDGYGRENKVKIILNVGLIRCGRFALQNIKYIGSNVIGIRRGIHIGQYANSDIALSANRPNLPL